VAQIESEKKRQDAERSGASAGLATALPDRQSKQRTEESDPAETHRTAGPENAELHLFMSQLWHGGRAAPRKTTAKHANAAAAVATDSETGGPLHKALALQYKARAEMAEEAAARATAMVHQLQEQGQSHRNPTLPSAA
jgi:hypothetical protein